MENVKNNADDVVDADDDDDVMRKLFRRVIEKFIIILVDNILDGSENDKIKRVFVVVVVLPLSPW